MHALTSASCSPCRQATPQHVPRIGLRFTVRGLCLPRSSQCLPLSLERRLNVPCASLKTRLARLWIVDGCWWTSESWPDAVELPPVSLNFPPKKNPLWKSVCVPDTSLTTQTSLTGQESLNFTSALVTDGAALHTLHKVHDDQLTCRRIGDSSKPADPIRWGQRHR